MKKKHLKKQVVKMTAILAAAVLTGCGGNQSQKTEEGTVSQESSTAETATEQAVEAPVELWIAVREDSSTLPTNSTEVLKTAVKEKFNVDLRVDCINKSNYGEKLNVMIASGEFPDIVDSVAFPRLGEAVEGGLLLPMNDLIETDSLWSTADPAIFQGFSYRGQVYGLPVIMDRPEGIYYRVDWLEKLGLEIPSNAEELYQVMKAFAKDDPDGNGVNDTYGLTMSSEYGGASPFWHLFLPTSPIPGFYIDKDTGKADNVFNHREDMEQALTWFNRLYVEGILDKEFVLNTGEDAESKFITGKAGCWPKGVLWIEPRQAKIQAANPDAHILSFPNLEGNYGVNLKQPPTGRALYLTKEASEHEDLAKLVLAYIAGPDGMKDLYFGKEGETYKVENGEMIWTNPDDASKYNPGNILSSPFEVDLPVESPLLEKNLSITAGYEISPLVNVGESATFNAKGADMKKVILEGITKIIIGEQPMEYLGSMTEDLNALGMGKVCEELDMLNREK
ncbi:hypothetical protein HMPREF1093_00204 [Hungatella hathewayi 12489931]|uniref:extracellular solute-binding protein n=1 Tax=Hungatella hathewayi TaxID=154046 RepID=UPI0002D1C13A|nr:extracellular solute-binding protein [Hungatella hathewayi]ENY98994.1 hypothetical protein HMPREF1093_00204 [Hungatella hathewayi 12489931]